VEVAEKTSVGGAATELLNIAVGQHFAVGGAALGSRLPIRVQGLHLDVTGCQQDSCMPGMRKT
jgi:hypothetical protein